MARESEFRFQLRLDGPRSWHDLSGDQQHAISSRAREVAAAAGFDTNRMWEPDLEEHHVTRRVTEMVWNLKTP